MKNNKKIVEQTSGAVVVKKGTDPVEIKKMTDKGINVKVEGEVTEDELDPMDFNKGQSTQDPHQEGPSSNDGYGVDPGQTPGMYQDGMDEGEMFEGKKKSKYNPWAICTASVGRKDKAKYERCVKDVKKSVKEGKNPLQPIVENAIERIIEKHISPKITKGDLLRTLSEQGIIRRPIKNNLFQPNTKMDKPIGKLYSLTKSEAMEQATKTKEKEAPTRIKPGTKEKPGTSDPFKNPKHQPKPKAELAINTFPKKASITKIPDYLEFDQLNINFKD